MIALVGLLVGAIAGTLLGHGFIETVQGALIGLIVGFVIGEVRKSRRRSASADPLTLLDPRVAQRLRAMERRIETLERAIATGLAPREVRTEPSAAAALEVPQDAALAAEVPRAPAMQTTRPQAESASSTDERLATDTLRGERDVPAYARARGTTPQPITPSPFAALRAWIVGGNTPARVGILVLLVGVGFLLKYAAEHVVVPIELRLAGVAFAAIVLLVLGWRLRQRRAGFAVILQGGGVAVLYLTVFAALRLYALVSPTAAFALLATMAALSAVLAIRQDAVALAVVGALGGFAAPILTSSQSGNHVMLFAWYALLNAAILGIAWFKAWRILNLVGFACTFVIGIVWGVTRYRADDFATTEPFLVLFFLFYVAIAVLYALRRSVSVRDYVDGTIVFGTPLVAAGLQAALVQRFEFGMAFSALAAAALYVALAGFLWSRHRDDLRLLAESFVALGVVFATLAVPLAFDARWTSATWALEGAAIVWVGLRQHRALARAFGLLLQLAAGAAYAVGALDFVPTTRANGMPVLNSVFQGGLLIALGGLVTALAYSRRGGEHAREHAIALPLAFAWGSLWWLGTGVNEIDRFAAVAQRPALLVAFLAATGVCFAVAARALAWPIARVPVLLLASLLLVTAIFQALATMSGSHLFAHGGGVAWPVAIVVVFALAHRLQREEVVQSEGIAAAMMHAPATWLLAFVAAHELAFALGRIVPGEGWRDAAYGVTPALALAAIAAHFMRERWPIRVYRHAYVVVAAVPLVAWLLAWFLVVGVARDANPAPLPYVPFINPVDLAVALGAFALAAWSRGLRADFREVAASVPSGVRVGAACALAFLWLNAVALRTLHHEVGIPWALDALWDATLVQVVLSLLWTTIALAAMVVANRVAARSGWVAGAALLAIVVAKLFVVDLSRVGSIERIVSFIGVGVLLLAVGYFAPVPARRAPAP
jgi:uncharacterized membrane protein